jgi:hypothetical protein
VIVWVNGLTIVSMGVRHGRTLLLCFVPVFPDISCPSFLGFIQHLGSHSRMFNNFPRMFAITALVYQITGIYGLFIQLFRVRRIGLMVSVRVRHTLSLSFDKNLTGELLFYHHRSGREYIVVSDKKR